MRYICVTRRDESSVCDPWQRKQFTELLDSTGLSNCSRCLPDCQAVQLSLSAAAAPFRRCDSRNLNLRKLTHKYFLFFIYLKSNKTRSFMIELSAARCAT